MHQNHFLTFTIHYITLNWNLVSRVMFTTKFRENVKSVDVIREMIASKFRSYGLNENFISKIVYVSDEGSNLVAAFNEYDFINCALHLLNKILKYAFINENNGNQITNMLDNIKSMVKHFKQSGLSKALDKSLRQSTDVRFNSNYSMLTSVYEQYDKIEEILIENQLYVEFAMNKIFLKETIDLLEEFEAAFKELQSEKKVTIHKVLLWKSHFLKICETKPDDSHSMKRFKVICKRLLSSDFKIGILHKVATFLHPEYNDLSMLEEQEINEVHDYVEDLMKKLNPNEESSNDEEPAAKKARFETFRKKKTGNKFQTEISHYIQFFEMVENLLYWWSSRENTFPLLSKVARKILAIPSSNAASERNFSSAGRKMEPRRNLLSPENLDELLFLYSNLD